VDLVGGPPQGQQPARLTPWRPLQWVHLFWGTEHFSRCLTKNPIDNWQPGYNAWPTISFGSHYVAILLHTPVWFFYGERWCESVIRFFVATHPTQKDVGQIGIWICWTPPWTHMKGNESKNLWWLNTQSVPAFLLVSPLLLVNNHTPMGWYTQLCTRGTPWQRAGSEQIVGPKWSYDEAQCLHDNYT
jgi:hypothetical protein